MVNVCYVISDVAKSFTFEWLFQNLDYKKLNVTVITLRKEKEEMQEFLERKGIKVLRLDHGKKNVAGNVFRCIRFFRQNKVEVVHAHLFEGCLVGLMAARLGGIKLRIHTRHNATIHHDYFPHAIKYDKLINFLSTKIISISDQVTKILVELEGVDPKKITKIHHGFDFEQMARQAEANFDEVRNKYGLNTDHFNIGVISRYVHYKGIQYIIPAFKNCLKEIPNARLILANAYGPYEAEVKEMLTTLPKDSYMEIYFENNVYSLIRNFNIFIHVPIERNTEAFGQVYIENMAMGVPGIFTLSGVADEIIVNNENALAVPFKNVDEIQNAILRLYKDKDLREKIARNSLRTVHENFQIKVMIKQLEEIYGA